MSSTTYEAHPLKDSQLPFIFHYNTVSDTKRSMFANWHNNIEILYVVEGKGEIICSLISYPVEAGDIFVVNSNDLHAFSSTEIMRYYCLIPDSDFCSFNGISTEDISFHNVIRSKKSAGLFDNVAAQYRSHEEFRSARIKSAVLDLLVDLTVNHSYGYTEYEKVGTSSDENIKLSIGYIKSHYAEQLNIDRIAAEAGLSKYYFIRQFKLATGLSPITFLNTIRCENAKKLLKKSDLSVHEIAEKCGYYNDSYFSKTFKKHIGCLPSEYFEKNNHKK